MTNSNLGSGLAARLRIPVDRLTTRIDENTLGFTSTQEVAPLDGTIGQERALRALDFGLDVDAQGFNIFVAGGPGSGRNTTLASVLGKLAASRPVPNDWVYVYNFADPLRPRGISLPAGMGRQLATDMGELASEAKVRIPRAFEEPEYQQRVEAALSGVHEQRRVLTEEMTAEAKSRGVALSLTESGITAMPLGAEGEPLTPFMRAAIAADFTNPFANSGEGGLNFVNADVTLYLHRLPVGEWVGFEVSGHHSAQGVAVAECTVYDEDGPIGRSTVCSVANTHRR